jgi:SAM-dependent methyltransferase
MPPPSERDITLSYYDRNAAEYCASTVGVDMSALYGSFLSHVPVHGGILDAGCGSGRDSLVFIEQGYDVVSIDGSASMVAATSRATGRTALLMRFDQMSFEAEFDGIWACASLLHISRRDIPLVFSRFERALKPGAVWFMSFKSGSDQRWTGGRLFNDYTEESLSQFIEPRPALEILRVWTTADARPKRSNELWTNALVRRRA